MRDPWDDARNTMPRRPQDEFERMVRTALNLCTQDPAPATGPALARAPGPARTAAKSTAPSRPAEPLPVQPRLGRLAAPGRPKAPGRPAGTLPNLAAPAAAAAAAGGILRRLQELTGAFLRNHFETIPRNEVKYGSFLIHLYTA